MNINDTITAFKESERGTDLSFFNLGEKTQATVKQIASECFTAINPKAMFVRALDTSAEFRLQVDCLDYNVLPQQVDCCVRWFEYELINRQA